MPEEFFRGFPDRGRTTGCGNQRLSLGVNTACSPVFTPAEELIRIRLRSA